MVSWRAPAALVLLALAAPASAHADGKPYVDATRGDRPARERTSAGAVSKRLGAQAVVDVDSATGTPRVLARLNGALTGPAAGSPRAIADAYVRSHLSDLGLTSADLGTLSAPETTTSPGGVTEVRWAQSVDGIPSAESDLRVNVAGDGRVINVLGSPAHGLELDSAAPSLDAGAAVRAVQDDLGAFRSLPKTAGPAGATQSTVFRGGSKASLQVLQRSGATRLVWRVFYDAAPGEFYDAIVDARTGEVLKRANMTKSATDGSVWDRYPGSTSGGTQRSVDMAAWLTSATTLTGPNAHAYSDINDDDTAQATEEVVPGSYGFTANTTTLGCSPTRQCGWDGTSARWKLNRQQNAVQAFYFVNKFHDHLRDAPIGFTAADGAFEGGDALEVNTDDGAAKAAGDLPDNNHIDNANMTTPPDGDNPLMQMYLFSFDPTAGPGDPNFREINGGDDAAIVFHEYTHGLSNRLVVDGFGAGALNTAQAGAMGEAWSDWYAMDYLVNLGLVPDSSAVDGQVDMGEYSDAMPGTIRNLAIDCAVGSVAANCTRWGWTGGFTYADFGRVAGGPEVHADGEIWAQMLWDIRTALGSAASEQIITEGMRLSPPEPSFLDERNAIIQADQALNGGANRDTLWQLFAARGMGYFAGAYDGGDVEPTADNSLPPAPDAPRGTIAGKVTNADDGRPLDGVTVGIAGLMNGLDALSTSTNADGTYTIEDVPEADYPRLIFLLDGWDPISRPVQVYGGVTTTRTAILRRNWASLKGLNDPATDITSNHKEFTGLGCGPAAALDQSEATGWSSENPDFPDTASPDDPYMTVRLPQAVNVVSIGLDAGNTCTDGLNDATSQATVRTSPNTTCAAGGTTLARQENFGSSDYGILKEFPPVAGAANVRCVRLILNTSRGGAATRYRDFSELGIYSTAKPVQPTDPAPNPIVTPPTPTPIPTVSPTPTPTPTPAPAPAPVAKVTFKLPSKGSRGAVSVALTCPAQCTATATLTADKKTAKKLKLTTLGKAAKAGKGSLKFTVKLSAKARKALKKRHLKSVTVTLKVSVRSGGKTTASSRKVKLKI
jgi:hypothetical protein